MTNDGDRGVRNSSALPGHVISHGDYGGRLGFPPRERRDKATKSLVKRTIEMRSQIELVSLEGA